MVLFALADAADWFLLVIIEDDVSMRVNVAGLKVSSKDAIVSIEQSLPTWEWNVKELYQSNHQERDEWSQPFVLAQ